MSAGQKFRNALKDNKPLIIPGTINAYSAILAEKSGHKAIYLSGGGVAAHRMDCQTSELHQWKTF